MYIEKKFNFIYITTNLINKKQYIGEHSCDDLKKDKYLGSGKETLWPAIKKYGKENFNREILEFFKTKQEAFDAQEKYIIKYNTLSPNGYNLSPSGGHGTNGGYFSEETKEKISKSHKGKKLSPEHCKSLSESHKGKFPAGRHKADFNGEKNPFFGKKHSIKSKIKMSEAKKGKPSNKKGTTVTKESREKMSKSHKGKRLSLEHKKNISKSMKILREEQRKLKLNNKK